MEVAANTGLSPNAEVSPDEDDVTEDIVFGKLVVLEKDNFDGPSFKFTGNAVFGRGKRCDVRINLSFISRKHAHLYVSKQGRVMLHNLTDRENATFINDEPLKPGSQVRINDKDTITIVDRSFRWEICPEFEVPSSNCISSLRPGKLLSRKQQLLKEEKSLRRKSEKIVISGLEKEKENVNGQAEGRRETRRSLKKPDDVRKVITPKPLLRKALATPIRIQIRKRNRESASDFQEQKRPTAKASGETALRKDSGKGAKKKLALPTPVRKQIAERKRKDVADSSSATRKESKKLALPTPIRKEISKKRKSVCASGSVRSSKPKRALPTPIRKQITRNAEAEDKSAAPKSARRQKERVKPASSAKPVAAKPRRSARKSMSKKRGLPTPVRKDIAKRRKSRAGKVKEKLKTPLKDEINSFEKAELNPLFKKLGSVLQQEIKDGLQLEMVMKKALNTPIRSDIQAQMAELRKRPALATPIRNEIARTGVQTESNLEISVIVSFYPRSEIEECIESFGVDAQHYQDCDVTVLQQRLDAMEAEYENESSVFDVFQGSRKTFASPVVGSSVHWTYSDYESDSNEDPAKKASALGELSESSVAKPKRTETKRRKSTRINKPKSEESNEIEKSLEQKDGPTQAQLESDEVAQDVGPAEAQVKDSAAVFPQLSDTDSPVRPKPRRKSLRLAARMQSSTKAPASTESTRNAEQEQVAEEKEPAKLVEDASHGGQKNVGSPEAAGSTSPAVANSPVKKASTGSTPANKAETVPIVEAPADEIILSDDKEDSIEQPGSEEEEALESRGNDAAEDEGVPEAVQNESEDEEEQAEGDSDDDGDGDNLSVKVDADADSSNLPEEENEVKGPKRSTRNSRRSKVAAPSRKTRGQPTSVPSEAKDAPKSVEKASAKPPEGSKADPATPKFEVGDHVKVYWEEDKTWYQGVIKSFYRKTKARVMYEDGELVLEPVGDLQLVSKASADDKQGEPAKRTTRSRATKSKGEPVRKSTRRRK